MFLRFFLNTCSYKLRVTTQLYLGADSIKVIHYQFQIAMYRPAGKFVYEKLIYINILKS